MQIRRLRAWWRAFWSILIAGAFLLVLVVSLAQQQAISDLKASNLDQSFIVARNTQNAAISAKGEQETKKKELEQARGKARELEVKKDQADFELFSRLQDVGGLARTITRSGRCPSLTNAPLASAPNEALWEAVQECAQDGNIPNSAAAKLTELRSPENNPTLLARAVGKLDREIKLNERDIQRLDGEVEALRASIANADTVTNALQDLVILDEVKFIKFTRLTWVPPALMQILLCFFSGLFGALLLTLILIVYPNNKLHFVKSESYGNRIFLGGLIAVAVYVIIGGGVAVLGSTEALIDDANFMSFCAIGILAGMFSERVASFLSDKGQIFLGDRDQDRNRAKEGDDQ